MTRLNQTLFSSLLLSVLGSSTFACSPSIGSTSCLDPSTCTSSADSEEREEPEAVLQNFASALESGDLDRGLSYLSERSRSVYESVLNRETELPPEFQGLSSRDNLQTLGAKLRIAHLQFEAEFGPNRDYTYACEDSSGILYQCLIRFTEDETGKWKIKNF